jgi:WD40 repeat protein
MSEMRPGTPGKAGAPYTPASEKPGSGSNGGSSLCSPPAIPDHELLRRIGRGAYGEVWLARGVTGAYRAVKIVLRATFDHDRPFEREFDGIQKFEPISRRHDSQVDILHVGRSSESFYYVMELADDQATGGHVDPDSYAPRTVKSDLLFHGRLQFEACLSIGIALATALEHLHSNGLVHRDVKPSNIIFVNGIAKLADIGLVTGTDATRSYVGTEGFAAPEGPGTVQADLYSLGKVLYEMATGKDRQEFPELPTALRDLPDREGFFELNAVITRACQHNPRDRYASAAEMRADLELLQSGKSLARLRRTEQRLRAVQRAGALVTVLAAVISLGWWWQSRQTMQVRELAAENLALAKQAEANASLAHERLYAADMNLVHQALLSDNLRQARALLQNHVPKPGQADLRGFEWRYLWLQSQGDELFSLPGSTNQASVLAFSPDDRLLGLGFMNGPTKLFNLADRTEVAILPGTNAILSISFSPQGDLLATASDAEVRLWSSQTFAEVRMLPDAVAPAKFDPQGKYLLTGKRPVSAAQRNLDELILWDTDTWTITRSITVPPYDSGNAARDLDVQPVFTSDAERLVVLWGNTIRLLTFPELQEIGIIGQDLPTGLYARPVIALSPDNRTLATLCSNVFSLRLWDIAENRELRSLVGHADAIFGAAFSPDGEVLATCSPDQTIKLWNVSSGALLNTFRGHADEVFEVMFSSDGNLLASLGAYDAVVKLWDPRSAPRLDSLREPVLPVGLDADGSLVGFLQHTLQPVVLDPAVMEMSHSSCPNVRRDVNYYLDLNSVSADGRLQGVWAVDENLMEVWDRRAGKRICSVPAIQPYVSFAPARQLMSTVTTNQSGDPATTIWQLPSGTAKWVLTNTFIDCISHDEQHLITGDRPGLRLWKIEADNLHPLLTIEGIWNGRFSPDGRLLAASGADGDIQLRSLPSAEIIGVLKGHTRKSIQLAFSPDGRTLASICDDRTVRLWHVSTQRELLRFQSSNVDKWLFSLEFSPDGRTLLTQREDDQGQIASFHHAPSFAEIAVAEDREYRSEAGQDPRTWLAVAKALQRKNLWQEALEACDEVLKRTANSHEYAWLATKAAGQRVKALRGLGRQDEAAVANCAFLGIPPRDPATPPDAIDLSAYYNARLADFSRTDGAANDLSELPQGIQTFDGSTFDVRGRLDVSEPSGHGWHLSPERVDGIRVHRRLDRLHFLQAAHGDSGIATGEQIGRYRINFADGRALELPIVYNQDTTDWWEHDHLPRELPGAIVAWRGANPRSRATGNTAIRLFKRTWQNPSPDIEVSSVDFVAEHPRTRPYLIALTAE